MAVDPERSAMKTGQARKSCWLAVKTGNRAKWWTDAQRNRPRGHEPVARGAVPPWWSGK